MELEDNVNPPCSGFYIISFYLFIVCFYFTFVHKHKTKPRRGLLKEEGVKLKVKKMKKSSREQRLVLLLRGDGGGGLNEVLALGYAGLMAPVVGDGREGVLGVGLRRLRR